jgi:hypothetical protein
VRGSASGAWVAHAPNTRDARCPQRMACYRGAIEGAGLRIETIRDNPYEFVSERAVNASAKYGVKSVSILAVKPA